MGSHSKRDRMCDCESCIIWGGRDVMGFRIGFDHYCAHVGDSDHSPHGNAITDMVEEE